MSPIDPVSDQSKRKLDERAMRAARAAFSPHTQPDSARDRQIRAAIRAYLDALDERQSDGCWECGTSNKRGDACAEHQEARDAVYREREQAAPRERHSDD